VVRGALLALLVLVQAGQSVLVGQSPSGAIRGVVLDGDFGVPVGAARVRLLDAVVARTATTDEQGLFRLDDLPAGAYSVEFSKEGYVRQVRGDVVVTSGRLTDLEITLAGEIAEMEEFVVQDVLAPSAGTEASLLELRFESAGLLDAVSSELISRAGASDAAAALRLVSGATVRDGKSAVVRGLPDRYVSSQLNGFRLPTADPDKRAVELDQFPASVISAVHVTKTFTPEQQGDASGGAVDLRLRAVPEEPFFLRISTQASLNTNVDGSDFLRYRGGGVSFWGRDDGRRDQQLGNIGSDWGGAVGVSPGDAPTDTKWSVAAGGSHELGRDCKVGGFASLFYERDSSFYDDGRVDSYWVESPGAPMTPETGQGAPSQGDFRTSLFDVTKGTQSVQWGTLLGLGIELGLQSLRATWLYTRTAEDSATLAVDTRGKHYFFPGHDPYDPTTPGHEEPDAAPYLRLETLEYSERTTETLQLEGRHVIAIEDALLAPGLVLLSPEITWGAAFSTATLNKPDKRQFGSAWFPARQVGPFTIPASHRPYKPSANFTLGNLQRIWQEIEEDSDQYRIDMRLPFRQWTETDGALRIGWFSDAVVRRFDQDTFSNFSDNSSYEAPFEQFWSAVFPSEHHPITGASTDVDYAGELDVQAYYAMLELPLLPWLKVTGGVRIESTDLSVVNDPEAEATWYPPGSLTQTQLNPGDGDAAFSQRDVLPSVVVEVKPWDELVIRAAYAETVARQTFKEITPILQQEFLGGPIFIGNPDLRMSAIKNYDLRADWRPYPGGLLSATWFRKDLRDPIEYVQKIATFTFTTAENYPEGEIEGFEFEVRQDLGHFTNALRGFAIGANATLIDSRVRLPEAEAAGFLLPNIQAPMAYREMTNAPESLLNLFVTYDNEDTGTQVAIFYTVQGDTLLAGAGQSLGNFVPSIFATAYDTLNLSVTQRIGDVLKLHLQAKNLTNAKLETVYRSDTLPDDVTRSSHTTGIEFAIGLSAEFTF
jgi:hypothetical protein